MKINVKVVTRARREHCEKQPDGSLKVWVTSPPVDGKANRDVLRLVSGFFNRPKSDLAIVRGAGSRMKVIEIAG